MVALAALQDSAALKTISTITTFFLPATFTAVSIFPDLPSIVRKQRLCLTMMISVQTLFSTTFFNFQDTGRSVVSTWIWLYLLITAILTAFTSYIWYWSAQRNLKEINLRHQNDQREDMAAPTSLPKSARATFII
jgi:hypothetical protein